MKNFLLIFAALLFVSTVNGQIRPGKGLASKDKVQVNTKVKPGSTDIFKAHVLVIEGSTYKDLCVPANMPGGTCSSYETAWKNGYLYTCAGNDGPKLVPHHDGDTFKCYISEGVVQIEIIPATAQAKKASKKKDY